MVSSASILLFALSQAAPAATSVALLTSVGEARDPHKRTVDTWLREAIEAEPTFTLLSAAETKEQLSSLADMGLICLPEDTPCYVKLGLAAGVDLVLVPIADERDHQLTVEVRVVDVAATGQARLVSTGMAQPDEAAMAKLAKEALGIETTTVPPPPPGEGEGEGEPPPATSEPVPLGLVVASVGGVLTGVAVAGALVCDLIFWDVVDVADAKARRELYQPLGAVLWISSAVGAGVLGSGIALMVLAPPENASE